MFRVAHYTKGSKQYLLDSKDAVAYFFSKESALAQARNTKPRVRNKMYIEEVQTLEDRTKSDYID